MSDEFDRLDATENAAIRAALIRCRVLAAKIANELRNKRPEQFVDKLLLADIYVSLEYVADVLGAVKGSQARGRQRRRQLRGFLSTHAFAGWCGPFESRSANSR